MKTKYISFFENEDNLEHLKDVDLVDKLVNFIRQNPFPKDHEQFHKFAETLGLDADILEQYAYAMLTLILAGGKSKGIKPEASQENFDIGFKIESEHVSFDTNNDVIKKMQEILQNKISYDHLTEKNNYYVDGINFKEELKNEGLEI